MGREREEYEGKKEWEEMKRHFQEMEEDGDEVVWPVA